LQKAISRALGRALSGEGAHVEAQDVVAGLDWKSAGIAPPGAPHTVFQLVNHLIYWQDWVVRWLDGRDPPLPDAASESWPGRAAPRNAAEWRTAVRRFRRGLDVLTRRSGAADLFDTGNGKSPLEMLQTIASHNSYHIGQIAVVRRMIGKWPPPSGGLTW